MTINAVIKGFELEFETSDNIFSPRRIDAGTLAMLSFVEFAEGWKVLDLGCGYGVVGLTAARFTDPANVYMVDVEPDAVLLSRKNAERNAAAGVNILQSDGFDALDEAGFDCILSNPPYHTDFAVAKKFIEKGFNRLKLGGKMFMVTKRKDWYKNKLISVFGGVRIRETGGYYVFEAEKRSGSFAGKSKAERKNGTHT
jgi:16S rRNA (guanine1207-N2)-methyltransferase